MAITTKIPSPTVARIFYKEIVSGDRKKVKGTSNAAATGGGARDFRFGSYDQIKPIILKMFPTSLQKQRKRLGGLTTETIFQGTFYWQQGQTTMQEDAFFEPPTTARQSEGRLARVKDLAFIKHNGIPPAVSDDRVFLLLIQLSNDQVWPHFVRESSLRTPGWHPAVAGAILGCLAQRRPAGRAVIGYHEFASKKSYCSG